MHAKGSLAKYWIARVMGVVEGGLRVSKAVKSWQVFLAKRCYCVCLSRAIEAVKITPPPTLPNTLEDFHSFFLLSQTRYFLRETIQKPSNQRCIYYSKVQWQKPSEIKTHKIAKDSDDWMKNSQKKKAAQVDLVTL